METRKSEQSSLKSQLRQLEKKCTLAVEPHHTTKLKCLLCLGVAGIRTNTYSVIQQDSFSGLLASCCVYRTSGAVGGHWVM